MRGRQVEGGLGRVARRLERELIDAAGEDRLHVPIAHGLGREGTRGRRFEPGIAVAPAERDEPEARAIALLWVRKPREDRRDHLARGRSDLLAPPNEARR